MLLPSGGGGELDEPGGLGQAGVRGITGLEDYVFPAVGVAGGVVRWGFFLNLNIGLMIGSECWASSDIGAR